MADLIQIQGLREITRSLRRIDPEIAKAMKAAGNKAAQLVVDTAQPRVPTGPGKGGHAASSIKAASTGKAARVSAGGKKYPYYPWLDFGGRVGPNKSVQRPFLKEGRYIWAAFADRRDEITQVMADELSEMARRAGLDVT